MLTMRNPFVSCMAVHPTGHFFAAGYEDGSIAFWATEDEDKPLLVRSIDEVDINLANEQMLNLALEPSGGELNDKPAPEPIYKLDWSGYSNSADPRGGTHTLAVLGGGRGKESSSVTVFSFSAFNPTVSGMDPNVALPQPMRKAMQDCLSNPGVYSYQSESTISDFLLLPRDTPHFSGSFDPVAIALVYNGPGDKRSISITEFPPPSLEIVPKLPEMARTISSSTTTTDAIGEELAETLHAMQRSSDPERLILPNSLWTGGSSVVGGEILLLSAATYGALCSQDPEASGSKYGLRGGAAWMDGKNDDSMHAKVCPGPLVRRGTRTDSTDVV
jgi:syntaxin-binding protein 5